MKLNLDEKISAAQTVAIARHVKPDRDCVGSCLAVCQYIRRYFPNRCRFFWSHSPYFYFCSPRRISAEAARGGGRAV